jgi:hypothetical protein
MAISAKIFLKHMHMGNILAHVRMKTCMHLRIYSEVGRPQINSSSYC